MPNQNLVTTVGTLSEPLQITTSIPGALVFGVLATFLPLALIVILLHECGHIATARYFNVEVKEVGLSGKGPFIRRAAASLKSHELMIASAGIFVNLLLACFFLGTPFATLNWILVLTNLIPWFGSDGQRIFRLLAKP